MGRIHAADLSFLPSSRFQLPEVLSSGHELPEPLQTPPGEEATEWSKIREDLSSLKVVSLQLRGEDGSIWNYKLPAEGSGREVFSLLPHMADMSTYMFKGIINFAKVISHFRWGTGAGWRTGMGGAEHGQQVQRLWARSS